MQASQRPTRHGRGVELLSRFDVPHPGKQVYFAQMLATVRESGLHDVLRATVTQVDGPTLRAQIAQFAPPDGLNLLQGTGVRDEEVFATPVVLEVAPGLMSYYRLLLGVSQKAFYTAATGLNPFKPMEETQTLTDKAKNLLRHLCTDLNDQVTVLLHALPQGTLRDDVSSLPLMALGAQADGSWRTQIGSKATKQVFESMKQIVRDAGRQYTETPSSITVENNSHREVTLALAPDPDVVIREDFGTSSEYKAAIEIKGGTDYSNVHNRAGEAEKSHAKAVHDGAGTCWTIIDLRRADMARLRRESASTREWIDLTEVLDRTGASWDRLVQITRSAMGI